MAGLYISPNARLSMHSERPDASLAVLRGEFKIRVAMLQWAEHI